LATQKRIAKLLSQAADISQQAASLSAAGQIKEALNLEQKAEALRKQARRAAEELAQAAPPPGAKEAPKAESRLAGERELSVRAVIVAALSEISVPVSPRAISDYARARFGTEIDHRSLPSLRRDEWRTWSSPRSNRVVYVVPALEGQKFLPVRGKLTLSDWPLERRLIGPWSERVDHLIATLQIARQLAWVERSQPSVSESLRDLVAVFAATVSGAIPDPRTLDPKKVEEAVQAELGVIGPRDQEWRAETARRARSFLNEEQLLWGAAPPQIIRRTALA
jgi:hypothetical protein